MDQGLSEAAVRRTVRSVRPEWTVREATPAESATDAVYHLVVEGRDGPSECVFKACTAVPPADFRPEPYLFTLLGRRTSVPGPRVIEAVDDHEVLPAPFFLMERCEGVPANTVDLAPETVERMARAAGRYAGEYHDVGSFGRFGRLRLDCDLDRLRGGVTVDGRTLAIGDDGHGFWRSWFEALYGNWIDDLEDRFVDLRPDIEAFVDARIGALDRPFDAVLGHIDYKPWNVLVRPGSGETTAVLDWGHATAVEPYYDLLLAEEHLSRWAPLDSPRRRRVRAALEAGYSETNELERDAGFEERRELYLAVSRLQPLVWFSEWTADEPRAERRATAGKHRQFVEDLLAE